MTRPDFKLHRVNEKLVLEIVRQYLYQSAFDLWCDSIEDVSAKMSDGDITSILRINELIFDLEDLSPDELIRKVYGSPYESDDCLWKFYKQNI